jgi:hypothetical protein
MLRDCPRGNYRYVPGIAAFSSGVVAMSGWEIVHATLREPLPWREGFARIERHLGEHGRPRTALCGIELRSPAPFTFDGFDAFNAGYRALLADWGILVDGDNPIPRTNVAPVAAAPREPSLYGFAYTTAGSTSTPTFVVAGAGEMRERARGADGIVRHGDTSAEAMREKVRFVMGRPQRSRSGHAAPAGAASLGRRHRAGPPQDPQARRRQGQWRGGGGRDEPRPGL